VTELPWMEAYQEVVRQFIVTVAITLVMAALASLSGLFIARRLTVPLVSLMGIATRIAGGERGLQAAVGGGPSEVAGLATAFNSMTAQLKMSLENLERQYAEAKQAEAALRESEERFRSLVETSSDWVWETDRNGVYTYASPRVAEVLGYTPEEVVGKTLFDLMPPENAEAAALEFRGFADSGKPFLRMEYGKRRKDGRSVVAESSGAPALGEDGSLRGYRGVDRDITEIKKAQEEQARLQEQLQQAMKMEAIGQLAGGVAHDFNNLLTVIIGNVDLASLNLDPADPAMAYFNPILTAAESAAGLTRQLLAFARRQLIQPKVLNLNDLVLKFKKAFIRLLGEDITLETILDEGLGNVRVDPGQIEQILVNLATNARAAMPSGGVLLIETSNVRLDEEYCASHAETRPGEYALLAVSDTGEGMSENTKSHVFEPFFTTKPLGQGTGLGLATVFGIVKQSQGSIELYSEEGHGAQFKIYFPRIEESPDGNGPAALAGDLPTGNQTILIAEDNEGVRQSMVHALEALHYKLLSPSTIEGALELSASYVERIDLLITDVVMPRMNGPELAERVRAMHPEMKVLFTSGYTYNVIAHHGIVNDGMNFLPKPYTIRALAEKVKQVLAG
jgi:PAS domain S-box-containing protein